MADEVCKLAERSARSPKEIIGLIAALQKESCAAVEQVEASNQSVRECLANTDVRDALGAIATAAEQVAELTREIEASMGEQSAGAAQIAAATQQLSRLTQEIGAATAAQARGIGEVVSAMARMDEVVEQTVCMTGELQAVAEQLSVQSDGLQGVVGTYRTEAESHNSRPAQGPRAPQTVIA